MKLIDYKISDNWGGNILTPVEKYFYKKIGLNLWKEWEKKIYFP